MPCLIPLLVLSVPLPDPAAIETLIAGEECTLDLTGGDGWVRILEDDYVLLTVSSSREVELTAFDDYGEPICASSPGEGMVLSAFSDYWFYIRVSTIEGSGVTSTVLSVDTLSHRGIGQGMAVSGALGLNAMAETFTFSPETTGSWTFRLEGSGDTDLDLEVYGTGMRLWGSSMSLEGFETVTVPALQGETLTAVVSRYNKSGRGEYSISVMPSGGFPVLEGSGESGAAVPGEMSRFIVPPHGGILFLDLIIGSPGADLDLLLRDDSGEYIMASQSYATVETLLLRPAERSAVAEVLLFDAGDAESVPFTLQTRKPGAISRIIPARNTVSLGRWDSGPAGFSPPAGGLFGISAEFEKTRDGDVRVFRGEGEPALTFASARGDEEFLLYVNTGDTVWIDPFFSEAGLSGDVSLTVSAADAPVVEDSWSGRIDDSMPVAFHSVPADAGTILDIGLSGGDREVDLDLYVTGPGLDLVAEGWLSPVDAAGDETVVAFAEEDAVYGVTVYLYERHGETDYDLEIGRIRRSPLAGPSPVPETWALCAGISGYPSAADVLNRASMDAVEFYEFLTGDQEVPEDHVILLVDALSTAEEFIAGMRSLLDRAGPEDRVVVFFSGHGDRSHPGSGGPEEGDSANEYLCLYDDDISDDRVAGIVDSLAAAPVFLFLDACHSGGFVNDFAPGSGVMVLTAAREDLSVSERVLTPILLQGSRGDADGDGNGYVSALELMDYIDGRLRLICPECDAELEENTCVCPQCGAVLKGDDAVPRPEQGMFLLEDVMLWRVR
ncbi:MAG: hypothetical protein AVO35_07285 [Candidatus Aegiribacteria sp. MLS_C]|nr:MAG: hypothetical protein AVO35_07285 [Candidatus Aegiribacteria sp. MLS_C]